MDSTARVVNWNGLKMKAGIHMKAILIRSATASKGPEGYVQSHTADIHLALGTPEEFSHIKTGETNSFELVAVAYSACMSGALNQALELTDTPYDDFSVSVVNHLHKDDDGGVRFEFELTVTLEGVANTHKQAIVDKAYALCPFSKAIKGNVSTSVKIL